MFLIRDYARGALFLYFYHISPAADQCAAARYGYRCLMATDIAAVFFTGFSHSHFVYFLLPRDRGLMSLLSAAGLTGVPAAALALPYFDKVVAENEIELPAQGHGRRHIGKESTENRHIY